MATQTTTKPKNQNTVSHGSGNRKRPSNTSTSRNITAASKRQGQGASNQNTDQKKPTPATTKQELVLTLLSRAKGASIDEVMKATNWQQHSVRGFFAGTVKKKLGFNLTSTKREGHARRYRIETNRR